MTQPRDLSVGISAAPLPARPGARSAGFGVRTPVLSIVIVNYRQWEATAQLVQQIDATPALRAGMAEVIVVDNHSPAHPAARRLRKLGGVTVRQLARNEGFARAVNEGCRLAAGDWYLLLNPDMTLTEGFLDGLFNLLETLPAGHERTGIMGFHLRHSDGSQQLSTGPYPGLVSSLLRLVLPRAVRKYSVQRGVEGREVAWATGCCLLIRRACMGELGGLDDDYFLYYEDVDLCRRARLQGWRTWYEPSIAVVHHHPLHTRTVPATLRLITRHSLLTYAKKHWPAWQFHLLRGLVQVEAHARRIWASCRGDVQQAHIFAALAQLCGEVHRNPPAAARRIHQLVRQVDVRIGV